MERNTAIDITKAFAIILMVIGHCDGIPSWLFHVIFSFHMPLFFIFSGYFYTPKMDRDVFVSGFKRLVKPYIATTFVCALICLILYGPGSAANRLLGSLVGCLGNENALIGFDKLQAGAIWFLLALFWCRLFFNYIYRKVGEWHPVVCFFIWLFSWLTGRFVVNIPLCVLAGGTSLIFYSGGALLRKVGIESIKYRICIYAIWALAFSTTYLNVAQYVYIKFPLSLMGAFCGTIFLYDLSVRVPAFLSRLLVFLGTHTLEILCCHTVAFAVRSYCLRLAGLDTTIILYKDWALVILTILLSALWLLLKEQSKKVNGKKYIN